MLKSKIPFIAIFLLCASILASRVDTVHSQSTTPLEQTCEQIRSLENDGEYRIGFVLRDLERGHSCEIRSNEVFRSASLYKLFVMAAAYEKIALEQLSLTDTILIEPRHAIDDAPEWRMTEPVERTIEQSIALMIQLSTNPEAVALRELIGVNFVDKTPKRLNLESTELGYRYVTTAEDISQFYERLYRDELIDTDSNKMMLEKLQQQQVNYLIPSAFSADTQIAHKTGLLSNYLHDAGIVYDNSNAYVITILVEHDKPLNTAIDLIQQITLLSKQGIQAIPSIQTNLAPASIAEPTKALVPTSTAETIEALVPDSATESSPIIDNRLNTNIIGIDTTTQNISSVLTIINNIRQESTFSLLPIRVDTAVTAIQTSPTIELGSTTQLQLSTSDNAAPIQTTQQTLINSAPNIISPQQSSLLIRPLASIDETISATYAALSMALISIISIYAIRTIDKQLNLGVSSLPLGLNPNSQVNQLRERANVMRLPNRKADNENIDETQNSNTDEVLSNLGAVTPDESARLHRIQQFFLHQEELTDSMHEDYINLIHPLRELIAGHEKTQEHLLKNLEIQLLPLNEYADDQQNTLDELEGKMSEDGFGFLQRAFSETIEAHRATIAKTRMQISQQLDPMVQFDEQQRESVDLALQRFDEDINALEDNLAQQRQLLTRMVDTMRSDSFTAVQEFLREREIRLSDIANSGMTDPGAIAESMQNLHDEHIAQTDQSSHMTTVMDLTNRADTDLADASLGKPHALPNDQDRQVDEDSPAEEKQAESAS
ncbi:MAG: serine hydrolase [Dehalococcoidia bacterium]